MSLKTDIIKILAKVDKIAKIGSEGYLEYSSFVDNLIDGGKYYQFERALLQGYDIDVNSYKNIDDMKKQTFPKIRVNTNSLLQDYIKKLYDTNGVYQVGPNIYDSTDNILLGIFKEIPPPLTQAYTDPDFALYKDKYSYTSLLVEKMNIPSDPNNPNNNVKLFDDNRMILFQKYVEAIKYILDIDYVNLDYIDEGYIV